MHARTWFAGLLAGLLFFSIGESAGTAQAATRSKLSSHKKGRLTRRSPPVVKDIPPVTTAVQGSAPPAAATPAGASGAPPPSRGPTRLDFDDRLVQGQTNKSGAVYLYDRKELKNRSMVRKPENFRQEIVGTVYDTP